MTKNNNPGDRFWLLKVSVVARMKPKRPQQNPLVRK